MEGLMARFRNWLNNPAGSEFDPEGRLDRLAVAPGSVHVGGDNHGSIRTGVRRARGDNPDRSDNPRTRMAVDAQAAQLSVGPDVTMPREVANYAENLIIRLLDRRDAFDALGMPYDDIRVAGCRKAISDAITRTDVRLHDAGWHPGAPLPDSPEYTITKLESALYLAGKSRELWKARAEQAGWGSDIP